jgi:hypothetical protein
MSQRQALRIPRSNISRSNARPTRGARITPNLNHPGRVLYEQPLNQPYPGEERMTLRERALNRHQYPLNEQSLRELRDLHFQQSVMQHLQEIRGEVRATHDNTRESLTRLELLRDQVEEVGTRIRREMGQIARMSRCDPTDIRTWHYCVKLYYQLLYTLFVLMIHTLHVLCTEMRSFGHALIWPFSIVVILSVWLGEMLIGIAISDTAVVGASFGQARFIDVFKPLFHGVYLLSYAILSVAYNTFRPYYTSVLSEMGEIVQQDINITAGRLALQQSGMNALALARNRTEQRVREIVVQEVGGLLNQTAEVPAMVYNATVDATMAAGAAVAGAGIAAASTVGEALSTVGTKVGEAYSSAASGVSDVVVPAARGAIQTLGRKIGDVTSTLYDFTKSGKSRTYKALPPPIIDVPTFALPPPPPKFPLPSKFSLQPSKLAGPKITGTTFDVPPKPDVRAKLALPAPNELEKIEKAEVVSLAKETSSTAASASQLASVAVEAVYNIMPSTNNVKATGKAALEKASSAAEVAKETAAAAASAAAESAQSIIKAMPSTNNVKATGKVALEKASAAAEVAKETAAAAASAAADSAQSIYKAMPSTNNVKATGKAAAAAAGEAAAVAAAAAKEKAAAAAEAIKAYWSGKGKTAKIEGGSKHRKGQSKSKRHTRKRKHFTILQRKEQKVFDQTMLGQSVIEMRDMINHANYDIPMNEEMYYNMSIVLQVVDKFIPFLLQGLDKSIDVCKLIHKHKIDIREHNDALIDGLVRI